MTFCQRPRLGRQGISLISLSILAFALATTQPVQAAEVKTHKTTESASKAEKANKVAKASSETSKPTAKTSSKKTETASADNDDVKSDRTAKSKTTASKAAASKSSTLADADDAKASKTKSATRELARKLADAEDAKSDKTSAKRSKSDTKIADSDDAKPSKGATGKASKDKAELAKAGKKTGKSRTELASKDEKPAKGKISGDTKSKDAKANPNNKVMKLADAAKAKPVTAKPASVVKAGKSEKLAELSSALLRLPQALFVTPETTPPVQEAKVVMNAAPVPYLRIRTQSKNTSGVLNATDAQLYQSAFTQIDQGAFEDAEATLTQVTDKSLVGYAQFHKLFSLNYTATYEELTAWLSQYGDQPTAMRVWALAKRKKPEGAPDPAYPSLMGPQAVATVTPGNAVQLSSTGSLSDTRLRNDLNPGAPQLDTVDSDLTPKSARSAYNNGQLEQAVVLARKIGDHWVAGLASWRLKRYDQALAEFRFVSTDPSRNAWSQSSGAYWAARSALKLGDKDAADTYFKIAASFPFTFYGLLAEQRLGVTPAVALARKGLPPTFQNDQRSALTASLTDDFTWTQNNAQARRMSALLQVGRGNDAQAEVQSAVQTATDAAVRDRWLALAAYNNIPVSQLKATDRLFDVTLYPIPDYELKANSGVDRALVYAFARKESKFNASAKSYSGAYGLLQLMPATAALVEDNPSFTSKPGQLLKPGVNLRVGQKYIARLMDSKIISGDLLRTIAAYNAGPRPVKDAVDSLGTESDSLLVMESIPVAQTRQYVEEVAANYWIYRQIMGKDSPSLVQAAADATIIDATADAESTDVAMAEAE